MRTDSPTDAHGAAAGDRHQAAAARIVVAGTFTAEPIGEILRFWSDRLALDLQVEFAPFGQVFQELLDPRSLSARNRGGVNLLLVRVEDLNDGDGGGVEQLAGALRTAAARDGATLLLGLCPLGPVSAGEDGRPARLARLRADLAAAGAAVGGVHVLDLAEAAARYRVDDVFDAHGEQFGAIPFTRPFFAAAGTAVARAVAALVHGPAKVAVLDCDGTLWDGVCGEDGPAGVEVGPHRRALQEFLLARQREGMLLCLSSKNNDADVVATFQQRQDFPLRLEHVVARRVNWQPKSENLRALAAELDLGLDRFVVLDDDPVACAEIRARCPEALVVALPRDAAEAAAALEHVWAFDRLEVTPEDRRRTALYRENRRRDALRDVLPTLEDFLDRLELDIALAPLAPGDLDRAAQLTQRTTQFNLRPRRLTAAGIAALAAEPGTDVFGVRVRDRFGDYGLVGLAVAVTEPPELRVDTLLLSCRVLGKHVEDTVVARLAALAGDRGCASLALEVRHTERNAPASEFLAALAPEAVDDGSGRTRALVDVEALRARAQPAPFGYRIAPSGVPGARPAPAPADPAGDGSAGTGGGTGGDTARPWVALGGRPDTVEEIAHRLDSAAAVLEAVRAAHGGRPELDTDLVAPRTATEAVLARIWADLLDLDEVGVEDDFFALGGHSILAAQALSRARTELGVEVSIAELLDGPVTIAELGRLVDRRLGDGTAREGAGADPDLDALLSEVEGLDDDEVQALLASESRTRKG